MGVPMVVYRQGKPKSDSWARWLCNRTMKKNQNNMVSVVGKTGSGKTWSAISICEIMSKIDGVPFAIDHIVFSLTELMDLINSGTLKRGSKIIFDEPQVSISAREYQSQANKVFNLLVSTFRHRNLTLFFATPFESLLDRNTRRMFHARFETASINSNDKTCELNPYYLEYSDFKKDAYRKRLLVTFKEKETDKRYITKKLSYWCVPKPSSELIKEYEAKKLRFTDTLNRNISASLLKFEQAGKSMAVEHEEEPKERKPLTDTQLKAMKVIANHTFKEASKILGVSMAAISQSKTFAIKKGYTLEEFKE